MKNRDDAILRKITTYCDETEAAINMFGEDINVFIDNSIFRNACCMPILQIGELCKLVSEEFRVKYATVDWRGWCGIRDIMAHQYVNLDYEKAWTIIVKDRAVLKDSLIAILNKIDKDGIERVQGVITNNNLKLDAEEMYRKIVDGTGVSLNAFSDDKLFEYLKQF